MFVQDGFSDHLFERDVFFCMNNFLEARLSGFRHLQVPMTHLLFGCLSLSPNAAF